MQLYRPVGVVELRLIAESGFAAFPPRLPHQPIFYPVLDIPYAEQIARDWNTKDSASGYAGFVTAFEISDDFVRRYPTKTVGNTTHRELWVPAEELALFNEALESKISVLSRFIGTRFSGRMDADTHLPHGLPEPEAAIATNWGVHRLDDNGNVFVVRRGLGLEAALRLVDEFEARGHKQTYWAHSE